MTSSHQSLVSDVAGDSQGPPDDVVDSEDEDPPLEKDIVRRRIDLFERQVSKPKGRATRPDSTARRAGPTRRPVSQAGP